MSLLSLSSLLRFQTGNHNAHERGPLAGLYGEASLLSLLSLLFAGSEFSRKRDTQQGKVFFTGFSRFRWGC